MREILFRGKQTDKDKWVYGVPVKATSKDESEILIIESVFACDEYLCRGCEYTPVIPETVGQYTGLTDKNGKKIFEGDVVLFPWYNEEKEVFCVEFEEGEFTAVPKRKAPDIWRIRIGSYTPDFEVIGNIHDNPDLLKGGADE